MKEKTLRHDWSASTGSLGKRDSEQPPHFIATDPTTTSMPGTPRSQPATDLSEEERRVKKKVRFSDTPSYDYTPTPWSNQRFRYVRSADDRCDFPRSSNLTSISAQSATQSGSGVPSATSDRVVVPSALVRSNVVAATDSKPLSASSTTLYTTSATLAAIGTKHVPFVLDSDSDTDNDEMKLLPPKMNRSTEAMRKENPERPSPVEGLGSNTGSSFWSRKNRNDVPIDSSPQVQRSDIDSRDCGAQACCSVALDLSQSQRGLNERAKTVLSHFIDGPDGEQSERQNSSNNIQQFASGAALSIAKPLADLPAKARKISVLQAQEQRRREDQRRTNEAKMRIDNARKREAEKHKAKLVKQDDERRAAKEAAARQKQESDAAIERNATFDRLVTAVKNQTGTMGSKEKATHDTQYEVSEVDQDTFVPNSKHAPAVTLSKAQKAREMRIQAKKAMNERRRIVDVLDELTHSRNQAKETNGAIASQNVARADPSLSSAKNSCCFSSHAEQSLHSDEQRSRGSQLRSLRDGLTSTVPRNPSGPMSLNSVAGLAAVADSTSQRTAAPKAELGPLKSVQYQRENLDVWKWRSQGMTWHEVSGNFLAKYNEFKTEKTLRDRHKCIRDAIDSGIIDVPQGFMPTWQNDEQRYNEKMRHLHSVQPRVSPLPVGESSLTAVKKCHPHEHMAANPVDHERPRLGGKTLNAQTFQYYMERSAEEWARSETDSIYEDDTGSDEEDFCEFEYQVVRREITVAEINDGLEINEVDFDRCGPAYFSPWSANKAAAKEIFRLRKFPCVDWAGCSIHYDYNEYGLAMFQHQLPSDGIIEVNVLRVMRFSTEGVPLRPGVDLAPKIVYLVKQRITTKIDQNGELSGDISETTTENMPENSVFTSAEIANNAAIKVFALRTFKSRSANLNIRNVEVTEKEKDCHQRLQEQGDGALFDCIGDMDTTKKIRVTVEIAKLLGPRNI